MYQTFLDAQRKGDLEEEKDKLKKMTPEPMNTMLTKQPRKEKKRKESYGCGRCPSYIDRLEK
jgi:hypothetical protein